MTFWNYEFKREEKKKQNKKFLIKHFIWWLKKFLKQHASMHCTQNAEESKPLPELREGVTRGQACLEHFVHSGPNFGLTMLKEPRYSHIQKV